MNKDDQLAKGFNAGYTMAKHDPELIKKLLKSANIQNDYIKGLTLGKAEFEKEALKAKLKETGKKKDQAREKSYCV